MSSNLETKWINHHTPCAVVPPPSIVDSENVIAASAKIAQQSPTAHGLIVYSVSADGSRAPLPLYYVSNRIAKQRKSPGLQAGWYIAGQPGVSFEVVMCHLRGYSSLEHTAPGAELLTGTVTVDGIDVTGWTFNGYSTRDVVWRGFLSSRKFGTDYASEDTVRRFSFCKTTVSETDSSAITDHDAGTIRLRLKSGTKGPPRLPPTGMKYSPSPGSASTVNEKQAKKSGVGVRVRRDGENVTVRVKTIDYIIENETSLPHATVTIFVREKYWLESRKIIDKDGNPYVRKVPTSVSATVDLEAGEYVIDLEKGLKRAKSEADGGARKKCKVERVVIDLTSD